MRPLPTPSATYHGRERSSAQHSRCATWHLLLEMRLSSDGFCQSAGDHQVSLTNCSFHPPLPPNAACRSTGVKGNKIWCRGNPALTTKPHQYCVAMNNR
ncbi:hypothetical protein CEXT_363731 [Caerostris extrusa]|uniref:Uncharacterized protein n=1 Tax=Caerostris extrusa TaxID=172846 RepID=A0AAV4Y0H3_CAEEX|nr:hypothetical protein CEXT_363731 [Caerostris extrusa]